MLPKAKNANVSSPVLMMSIGESLVEAGAETLELSGNASLLLDSPASCWWVEAGRVELFAVEKDKPLDSPRHHVATIESGRLLCGAPPAKTSGEDRSPHGQALLALGLPGTRLRALTWSRFLEMAESQDLVPRLAMAVNFWLDDVLGALSTQSAPKDFLGLEPGAEISVEGSRVLCSAEGSIWVRLDAGEAAYFGQKQLRIEPSSHLLPIHARGWWVVSGGSSVKCSGTRQLLSEGKFVEAYSYFWDFFLELLARVRSARRVEDARRIENRSRLDLASLTAGVDRLASLLAKADVPAQATRQEGSALFLAVQHVAKLQGQDLRRPTGRASTLLLHEITRIAAASRIRIRRVMLRDQWWRKDNGALVGFRRKNSDERRMSGSPVALVARSPTSYEVYDPASGRTELVNESVASTLEDEAFMLYPSLPERALSLLDLVSLAVRGRHRDLAFLTLLGAAAGALALLVPLLTGYIFGVVIPTADRPALVQIGAALGVAAATAFGLRISRGYAILRVTGKLDGTVQPAVWDRLLALPTAFYRQFSSGDLLDRSMAVDKIRTLLVGGVIGSLIDAVFSVFSFGLLFYFSWRLALVALALVTALSVITVSLLCLQVLRQRQLLREQGKLASLVAGLINGVGKLRAAGGEARAFQRWAAAFGQVRQLTIEVRTFANAQAAINAFFLLLSTGILFAFAWYGGEASLSTSGFLAFLAAYAQFQTGTLSATYLLSSLLEVVPLVERVRPLLEAEPEADGTRTTASQLSGKVELSRVSFRYSDSGPLVLDDVSLKVEPGEFVALVGPSGSGKSTILRMILGFERPESGSVYFDGQSLESLDVFSVRRQLGVVLQDNRPMGGDIFQNIIGSSNLGIEQAWEAAEMAGIDQEIRALPMGLHSLVSEGGGGFSGGQIQRLLIARALVHRPRIVLFDEATSALDNQAQEQVRRSLDRLKTTRIVVAHRLSTIRNADRIYVLDTGRVVEAGSFTELMTRGGLFSRLAARQVV